MSTALWLPVLLNKHTGTGTRYIVLTVGYFTDCVGVTLLRQREFLNSDLRQRAHKVSTELTILTKFGTY